ncbi:MAG: sugar phosphate nucleotidyltransferase [Candidatus Hodarchaeales archaeon]|jgi:NDP-sugar pyrophosphorylase family protein
MKKPVSEAVVLAGGKGSRLFPLTKERPKPLVPVGNYTMLDWNFHILARAGIKKVVLVVKYLGEQIREHIINFTNKYHPDLEITVPNVDPLDTADAVRQVSKHITQDNFFVTMADIITNIELEDMANFHVKKGGLCSISLKSINRPRQFGVILLNKKSRILLFLEKPLPQELYLTTLIFHRRDSIHFHANLVNTGIYCFKSEILDILDDFRDLMDFGKNVFPFLLEKKRGIYGYTSPHVYYWQDCGNPEQLLWANWDVAKRWNWPYLPRGEERNGSWWGNNIQFGKNLTLDQNIVIGNDVIIEDNVTIKALSVIGDNCHLGKDSIIDKAILWENVVISQGCKLNKCIIANNVVIGENTTIDEHAVIRSGMKILANEKVSAGQIIE